MGMGASTAEVFARAGAKVVVVDFNTELGQLQADKINESGGDALFVYADISKEKDIEAMVRKTVEKYGRLDIAINNAARKPDAKPIHEMDEKNLRN